jgi:hypothetical protein
MFVSIDSRPQGTQLEIIKTVFDHSQIAQGGGEHDKLKDPNRVVQFSLKDVVGDAEHLELGVMRPPVKQLSKVHLLYGRQAYDVFNNYNGFFFDGF